MTKRKHPQINIFCITCNKVELTGRQTKFCSTQCNFKAHYTKISSNQKERYTSKKKDFISLKGGKCERCGYDKCLAALEFHHLDPSKKEIQLSGRNLSTYSRERLLKELDKCLLLCANCHREIHWLGIENL